jgi:bifunctional ADP-heptose synthase (sugar kinase/adenylyltransferase)
MSIVWNGYIEGLAWYLDKYRGNKRVVMTSCPADLLHAGHVRSILHSKIYGEILVVVVNGDGFLERKKGYFLLPLQERLEIIGAIGVVDHVVSWDDGSQFVDGAIRLLKPNVFTKGGDRSRLSSLAQSEVSACREIGCEIALGVGGYDKVNSSTAIVRKVLSLASSGVLSPCQ